jgi:hypothetical protein
MTAATTATTATTAAGRGEGPSREILVLAGVIILGTIMTVLDLTIVNVAIPTLAVDFLHQPAGGRGRGARRTTAAARWVWCAVWGAGRV